MMYFNWSITRHYSWLSNAQSYELDWSITLFCCICACEEI